VNIDRREALARLAGLTGTLLFSADAFLTGCRRADKVTVTAFTPTDIALMDEIGETIIPATTTPGAKAAGIGAFMAMMINDCYDDATHAAFVEGLRHVDAASRTRTGKSFVESPAADRTAILNDIQRESRTSTREPGAPPHYFRVVRELTLLGYFSSEVGCTQALRYVETPGSYDGNVTYHKGDRAFFNPARRF
jgi:hypothetical protein